MEFSASSEKRTSAQIIDVTDADVANSPPDRPHEKEVPPHLAPLRPTRDVTFAESNPSDSDNENNIMATKEVTYLLIRHTAAWVFLGVAFMVLGIGLVQGVLFPLIHTCPPNAICSTRFDPNNSNVLNLLQSLMNYWLQAGLVVAGFGLLKLSAYQAWFGMMRYGNTIDNFDLILGAIKGDLLDAARLVFRKGTSILSLLVLAQIGIGLLLNLVIGLSIIRTHGERVVPFSFSGVSQLPNSGISSLNSDGQLRAIAKVVSWALTNDTTHHNALRGSLVVPDGRSNSSVSPLPGGPIIDGNFVCTEIPEQNITKNSDQSEVFYNITLSNHSYLALRRFRLAVTEAGGIDTATIRYLWVTNTTGFLPNATSIDGGAMYATLCRHYLFMRNTSDTQPHAQYLEPNTPNVPGCSVDDPAGACVADSVSNAILSWWGGIGQAFWKVTCRGGVLGPLQPTEAPCPLTIDLWRETATSMLDGIMQTAPTSGESTQTLTAVVEVINPRRWWLQAVIPLLTLVLYGVALMYTCYLSQGNTVLKELNLSEVIDAAQTDHIRDLVQTGRLGKSLVRYGSNVGFLSHQPPNM